MATQMRERTQAELDALPKDVFAGPGDSYPIETVADLENAIQAFGRSSDPAVTKRGIIRRARALKRTDLLPADWDGSTKKASEVIARASALQFSLPTGMSYQDVYNALQNELTEQFGNPYGPSPWLQDFDDAICYYDDGRGETTGRPYTLTPPRDVMFGAPFEVVRKTQYVKVTGDDGDEGAMAASERAFASKRHSAKDQDHLDQAADHLMKAGAMLPDMTAQIPGGMMVMREAVAVQMTEDANLRAMPFTLPEWFSEGTDTADLPQWVPYLPTPHDFAHPVYGTVSITPERIANFVTQFNAGVYQDEVPLDGEHRTKESGALAWVQELRTNEDGSADARVRWTKRGEQMYRDGAFKYISPEWYDEWSDPATGQAYQDIAIGGALTTRPFFKSPYLRPLTASESGDGHIQPHAGERSQGMTATTDTVSPAQFTELESKFTELNGKFEASEAARTAAEAENTTLKQANETLVSRVDGLEKDARTKRYTELVTEWPGGTAENVAVLERFREAFGEDSDQFKAHVATMSGAAAQLKDAGIFREVGSNGSGSGGGAAAQLDALAKQMSEKEGIPYSQAYDAVLQQQPQLYAEYEREQRG